MQGLINLGCRFVASFIELYVVCIHLQYGANLLVRTKFVATFRMKALGLHLKWLRRSA